MRTSLKLALLIALLLPAAAGAQSGNPFCAIFPQDPSCAPAPTPTPPPSDPGQPAPAPDPQPQPQLPTPTVSKRVTRPIVGLSDQSAYTLADPTFLSLGIGYARYITPWNSVFTEPHTLDQWLQTARLIGIEPFISFNHSAGDKCPARPCHAPSVAAYAKAFRSFRLKYPWVKVISPWNEANHQSQPLANKPKLAAQYYNVVRKGCPRCQILAADVLDSTNLAQWLTVFVKTAKKPRLWGLHNYTDTNRFRSTGTKLMLKLVRGPVWVTETGGVVSFKTADGRNALPHDESRAARSVHYLFTLVRKYRSRIKRVYLYQFRSDPSNRFDSGLVKANGSPRPSYTALQQEQAKSR